MAGKKSVIETGVDKLVKLIGQYKKISVKQAAKELGVSVSSIEEWADFLEEEGIISVESKFATVYLIERKISKKDIVEKVKAVKDEKEHFMRRVESSINALERDSEEIKLIDSEFRKIKGLLEANFSKLSEKLAQLEDFKKSHRVIEDRRKELEGEYEGKVKDVEVRLNKEHKEHEKIMADIEDELKKIGEEREKIELLKTSEKELRSKVGEINVMIEHIRKEIDKENEQLEVDEKRLKKSEELAHAVKEDVAASSKELDEVSAQVKESRKEISKMENEFVKDLQSLSKGDLEKIGPYKESKHLIEKAQKFFADTRQVDDLIGKAEKEEEEIREHFLKLAKKVSAFSVVTSVPEIKKEMEGLHHELAEIEARKSVLADQLRKLRSVVRAVAK